LKETLITLLQHGVKIRLLTNSLASIDMCSAFSAYKKTRKELIKAGIEIYEFKPHPDERVKLMLPDKQKCTNYKAVFGLHSKTILIDDYTAIIGSYNLDPRSADYNTECLSLIRSAEVAQHLSKFLEEEFLPQNSWPVTKDHNPDSKAKLIKRFRAACFYLFPKKLL
jgi:putative cardiolipin synthase